jgi:chromosome segregation ATPase
MDAVSFVLGGRSNLRAAALAHLVSHNVDQGEDCSVAALYRRTDGVAVSFSRSIIQVLVLLFYGRILLVRILLFMRLMERLLVILYMLERWRVFFDDLMGIAENIDLKQRNFLVFQGDVETIASQGQKDLTHSMATLSNLFSD